MDQSIRCTLQPIEAFDFEEPADSMHLGFWTCHWELHDWMERLYKKRGGAYSQFVRGVTLRLDEPDIRALEEEGLVASHTIETAVAEIALGWQVYCTSSGPPEKRAKPTQYY